MRAGVLLAVGIPALIASLAVATAIGPADLSPGDVAEVVRARLGFGDTGLSRIAQGIVWDLRLPRTLLAAVCGAGLAVCGAVLQSVLRNPLADPFLLGISAGASTGAVAVVVLGLGVGTLGLTAGAFLGAAVAFGVVVALAAVAGGGPGRVVLAGVAATQLFSAVTSYVVITSADAEQTRGVLFWLLGSLSRARWGDVGVAAAVCAVAIAVCLARANDLDAFAFGADAAASLGVAVRPLRATLLGVTALLTATLVAVAGAIGFVGLVLPHAARLLVGPGHRAALPVTALLGALLLVWVDTLARTAAAPLEVPAGVVTALVGVPAFAVLLARRRAAV
ncbi:FecCD family ABC transporter permease [Actinokineospora iranica]|uniref:Iron complex transport system permease protein n=1 Tax=Actinokineospora iranica TaxID=1271860 RepID=A0A1G6KT06_9PSEU|nr:iron chelate uptake ABC transporter family permease subunit [Actinokineospora iranica]SDC33506.1 iron complex transport system permease protein [Actinokineospora iranica]